MLTRKSYYQNWISSIISLEIVRNRILFLQARPTVICHNCIKFIDISSSVWEELVWDIWIDGPTDLSRITNMIILTGRLSSRLLVTARSNKFSVLAVPWSLRRCNQPCNIYNIQFHAQHNTLLAKLFTFIAKPQTYSVGGMHFLQNWFSIKLYHITNLDFNGI